MSAPAEQETKKETPRDVLDAWYTIARYVGIPGEAATRQAGVLSLARIALVDADAPSGDSIHPGTCERCKAAHGMARDFGKSWLCDACWSGAPSGEGMPESDVERDARDRLDRYSGGVRSWDVWPKEALASRRMDLRIVLARLAKVESRLASLTHAHERAVREKENATEDAEYALVRRVWHSGVLDANNGDSESADPADWIISAARAAVEAEREACVQAAETVGDTIRHAYTPGAIVRRIVDAIRSRSPLTERAQTNG